MICPVEIADDLSAFQTVRVGDHARHGIYSKAAVERAKRVPLATAELVLGLYRERYFDLNVRR